MTMNSVKMIEAKFSDELLAQRMHSGSTFGTWLAESLWADLGHVVLHYANRIAVRDSSGGPEHLICYKDQTFKDPVVTAKALLAGYLEYALHRSMQQVLEHSDGASPRDADILNGTWANLETWTQ